MCGGEKRKNTEVSAKSVGLPVVPFQYGLSLFVCLSKWFTFFVCPSVTVRLHGRLLRLLLTVLSYTQAGTFSTKLSYEELNFKFSTFLSYEARNPCLRIGDVVSSLFFFVLFISQRWVSHTLCQVLVCVSTGATWQCVWLLGRL